MGSGDLISRVYSSFRGVDFRGDEINLVRSPDSLNVWKDYKETDSIRTRPEMDENTKITFADKVYGISFYKVANTEMMIVHSGDKLYKVVGDEEPELLMEGVNTAKSSTFVINNNWFFIDGKNFLRHDGAEIKAVENGTVPTTSIKRSPKGGGELYQEVNMFSPYRINDFKGDGESVDFFLDAQEIDDETPTVTVDGETVAVKSFDRAKGKVTLRSAPAFSEYSDNVSIKFKKTVPNATEQITKCTMLELFDNRVFFSGNPDHPNKIYNCMLEDPTYWCESDSYNEGLDSAAVKGMATGNNNLWVFKEPSQANTTIFYHTPVTDDEFGKIYPNTHSSISTGCIGKAINFNDDIVFFSDRGMEGISGDITTEQVISHRSSLVDRKLIAEPNYADMILEEWEGYLVVIIGSKVYLADSRATFTNEDHYEYEWFYWELNKEITCAKVNKGVLYLGTDDGVYKLTDTTSGVESYWVTPKDKFNHPQYLKTSNKRGCVVESTGDISVYAKTEKTEDFELIGIYENITDYFVSRIKRKKFKDIQLKFYSTTRFSLETATLECFIGGYTKR